MSLQLPYTLHSRQNERDGVSNLWPLECLFNRLFRSRSKKTSKLCVTGLCEGNSPPTGEFPAQRVSNGENVSISWRHHVQSDMFLPYQWWKWPHNYKSIWSEILNLSTADTSGFCLQELLHRLGETHLNRNPKSPVTQLKLKQYECFFYERPSYFWRWARQRRFDDWHGNITCL